MNKSIHNHKHIFDNSVTNQQNTTNLLCDCSNLKLDGLFNPIIKVILTSDWSKIKAIWIPLLHHDYLNQLQRSEIIKILEPITDKFGTIQGYLTAPHENYIPYLTRFFNPLWTKEFVIEQILEANSNIIETIAVIIDQDNHTIIKKNMIGATKSGMNIDLTFDKNNCIIDASPLFSRQ